MRSARLVLAVLGAVILVAVAPEAAAPTLQAEVDALVGRFVEALKTNNPQLLRSVYHPDLRMSVCNAFDRFIGHVVFGDASDLTPQDIQDSTAVLTLPPRITGVPSAPDRIPVVFGIRWMITRRDSTQMPAELTVGIRWELTRSDHTLVVRRQQTQPCETSPGG
jgi:hypothetical protein